MVLEVEIGSNSSYAGIWAAIREFIKAISDNYRQIQLKKKPPILSGAFFVSQIDSGVNIKTE